MSANRSADKVESFIAAVDAYEPQKLAKFDDAFRVFARFISRNLDGRYLERHPASELLPDLEQLLAAARNRPKNSILVQLHTESRPAGRRAVLITCLPDVPFIYSTVRQALDHLNVKVYRPLPCVVPLLRDEKGDIISIGAANAPKESLIWAELDIESLGDRHSEVENYISARLETCRTAVNDFNAIKEVVAQTAARYEALAQKSGGDKAVFESNARLLRWLLDDYFVFLGTRFIPAGKDANAAPHLGIGKLEGWRGIQCEAPEKILKEFGNAKPYVWIRKSRTDSWIYRPGRMDDLIVNTFNDEGKFTGILFIEGLFNFRALAKPRTDIPVLDRMIEELFAQMEAQKGSHLYRSIRNAFNSLPLEYLFTLPIGDVRELIAQILEVDAEHRLQVHVTTDAAQGFAFVFVALPRSHYSDELRSDIRKRLKEIFKASSMDDGVYAGETDSVTFHYFLSSSTVLSESSIAQLKSEIEQLAVPWTQRLQDELTAQLGVEKGRQLYHSYGEAFSPRYQEESSAARAVRDIQILEDLAGEQRFDCDLFQEKDDKRVGMTRLRMFESEPLLLSNILPILDNLGLTVIDEFPTIVQARGKAAQTIATFRLSGVRDAHIDLLSRRNRLREAIRAIVAGAMENDSLNRLLLRADIPWNYVALVRAFQHYARQLNFPYSFMTVEEALLANGDVVRAMTELFRVKFDPDIEGVAADQVDDKRQELVDRARRTLLSMLSGISDLTSDQVLRFFYELVEATVRTNFYARNPQKEWQVVFKFDPSKISRMPEPKPFREIYVHHPLVAGVHLRGGPVARGGLRWSDRNFDYRTEVLGLMTTQNLKNVLIVPRGAKGGFVLRQAPADPAEKRAAADEKYKIFIRGLLSVTDNLVDGKPRKPDRVLRYDGDDHYFVVAADKGTAHLSDTANGLALESKFWLGDAFASGGSKGYDHKKEGITARGAWECCKRHFHEMGINPEADKLRIVGVGDMSGDVFGNGLLRSQSVQLIAAFDHRHIFIDPNPDAQSSFAERERMFKLPRSSWDDYAKNLISKGGGVYPRGAKAIELSAEAQAALGTGEKTLSGPELIKVILRAPVDLLWNGGIGTYIKSSRENHIDVGDPATDSVRVDATEIRALVISEGGNLGITPQGRVELASRGVRLNTDALDNSAGVDLSDHEVNLKILFQAPLSQSRLSMAERDRVLEKIKEEVCDSVLLNNWTQSRMISLDEQRSRADLSRFARTIQFLSERVPFKRRDWHLPDERSLAERSQLDQGLYRPELAVLAAYAKLDMKQELVKAESFDLAQLETCLFRYFPDTIRRDFKDDVLNHPLAIHIARTILTNDLIADAGVTFLAEAATRTGQNTESIVKAYLQASEMLLASELKAEFRQKELALPHLIDYRLRIHLETALEELTCWLLLRPAPLPTGFAALFRQGLDKLIASAESENKDLVPAGFSEKAAHLVRGLSRINEALDLASLASNTGCSLEQALGGLQQAGEQTGLTQLIKNALDSHSTPSHERPARYALREQLRGQLIRLGAAALGQKGAVALFEEIKRDLHSGSGRELPTLVLLADRLNRRMDRLSHRN